MNRWPSSNEWLFSVKTFAAAMLALYIAMAIGLDRPYWAMATVYIVSQPLIGALRSKAVFRLVGTAIGATATIVLVPNLVDAPELLSAALALWTGGCLYIALLDRTPRSYVFMLAGYTAALIGFPAVDAPATIWDVALARVEEIWLGIICSTVIATVVFPRQLGPLLSERILAWTGNASVWTRQVLDGTEDKADDCAHLRLAADAVELRMLASQLAWDNSIWQSATRWVGEMQRRMVLLLPVLSSISDRLAALRAAGAITPGLRHLLAELSLWARAGAPPPRAEADRMRHAIQQLQAETDPGAGWNQVMRCSLLLRLHDLVDLRQDMRDLRRHIEEGGGPLALPLAVPAGGPERLHHDQGLAMLSGLAAAVAVLLTCGFWIATGWQAGSGMAALAAAACCLFATLDDPTPALKNLLLVALVSVVAVGIGLFAILPKVHDFEMLALVLAAFFVPVGLLAARPATQPMGSALGFLTATLLSLQGAYSADFVSYADGGCAALLGVASAVVVTALMRSVGAEWSARRLLRADWRDLAAIPARHAPPRHPAPTRNNRNAHDRNVHDPNVHTRTVPDRNVPDRNVPDPNVPDPNVPDPNVSDRNAPDPNAPDRAVPDRAVPNPNVADRTPPNNNIHDRNIHDRALYDRNARDRNVITGLLLDRLGLLVPRLAGVGAGNDLAAVDALADLRIGINMTDLENQRDAMPPALRETVDTVLHGAAAHYAAQAAAGRQLAPPATLLSDIDRALDAVIADADERDLLLQMVGIRRGLFVDAAPYQPPPPPDNIAPAGPPPRQAA